MIDRDLTTNAASYSALGERFDIENFADVDPCIRCLCYVANQKVKCLGARLRL